MGRSRPCRRSPEVRACGKELSLVRASPRRTMRHQSSRGAQWAKRRLPRSLPAVVRSRQGERSPSSLGTESHRPFSFKRTSSQLSTRPQSSTCPVSTLYTHRATRVRAQIFDVWHFSTTIVAFWSRLTSQAVSTEMSEHAYTMLVHDTLVGYSMRYLVLVLGVIH